MNTIEYEIQIGHSGSSSSLVIALVENDNGISEVIAKADVETNVNSIAFRMLGTPQSLEQVKSNLPRDVSWYKPSTLDDAITPSHYAAFRQGGAIAIIGDAAYSLIEQHVSPNYEDPSIDVRDDYLTLTHRGKLVNARPASRSGSARPRARVGQYRLQDIWI